MSTAAQVSNTATGLYPTVLRHLDEAAGLLNLAEDMHQLLSMPKRILSAQVPIERENGRLAIFTGYRVQHNINRGPALGSLRYSSSVTPEDAIALAMMMTWRCALLRLPFGGAAGAVVCAPRELTHRELERLTRRYATEMAVLVGPSSDILMPDLNTDEQIMAWIMDTFSMHVGYSVPAVVAGKPVSIGGTQGQTEAAGRGVFCVLQALAGHLGRDLTGRTVAIQGFGQVGSMAAAAAVAAGCRVVGISDITGGLYRPQGLDVPALLHHVALAGTVLGYADAQVLTNEELLTCSCDVLILAAVEDQVTARNAGRVQAQIVVEGANGPISDEADAILADRGITVIPDVLAGSGGATVAYFEWVQGLQQVFWTEEEVRARLEAALTAATGEVVARSESQHLTLRQAAYCQAVEAVALATDLRGIYP